MAFIDAWHSHEASYKDFLNVKDHINDDGFIEPGSRESGYFKTREEAEKELEFWKRLENDNCLADW